MEEQRDSSIAYLLFKMKVVNNINIKGKDYEISKIINSFLFYTNKDNANQSVYINERLIDGKSVTTKLCYESIYDYDNKFGFKKVEGISFCFNGDNPCCISYKGLWYNNAIFLTNTNSIMQFGLDADGYKPASFDTESVEHYINVQNEKRISDIEKFIGRTVLRNLSCKVITSSGMKIQIPIDLIIKSIDRFMLMDFTYGKFYAELSRSILSSRNKGKDMSWYIYKIYLVYVLIRGEL